MNKIISITGFCLVFIVSNASADSLLDEVRKYGESVSRIEKSVEKVSIGELIQKGSSIADRLRPVIENFSQADYEFIEKNMKGFIVNREEVIVVQPDSAFFLKLANRVGTEKDRLYFTFLNELYEGHFWPAYIDLQTDVGGCTRYGEGILSNLFGKGKALLPKVNGYYAEEVKKELSNISSQLAAGRCACGNQESVVKELRLFLELNKESEIAGKIKNRLDDVEKSKSDIEFNCVGGR
jgi:hypothetical protein